jgi:hypothetical protein
MLTRSSSVAAVDFKRLDGAMVVGLFFGKNENQSPCHDGINHMAMLETLSAQK